MKLDLDSSNISFYCVPLPLHPAIEQGMEKWLPESLRSVPRLRQQEFLAGRFCAAKASELMGVKLQSLPRASSRGPIWPKHLVGSISHSKDLAICCVSYRSKFRSLGIDVEDMISENILRDILPVIANLEEIKLINKKAPEARAGFTVLFSGKEALYKALFPLCHCFIDFLDVHLTELCFETQTFSMRLVKAIPQLEKRGSHFKGSFQQHEQTIISIVTVSN